MVKNTGSEIYCIGLAAWAVSTENKTLKCTKTKLTSRNSAENRRFISMIPRYFGINQLLFLTIFRLNQGWKDIFRRKINL